VTKREQVQLPVSKHHAIKMYTVHFYNHSYSRHVQTAGRQTTTEQNTLLVQCSSQENVSPLFSYKICQNRTQTTLTKATAVDRPPSPAIFFGLHCYTPTLRLDVRHGAITSSIKFIYYSTTSGRSYGGTYSYGGTHSTTELTYYRKLS
jgi:hypothetical protein